MTEPVSLRWLGMRDYEPTWRSMQALTDRRSGCVLRRRSVQSRVGNTPRHVMQEVIPGGGEHVTEEPLIVHEGAGRSFSPEVKKLLRES